jgi:creatinine amidohydrolase
MEKGVIEVEWSRLKAHEVRARQAQNAIVIVPIGSFEQHGPHLPVQVDALLAGEIARRTAVKVAIDQAVIVTPTVWCSLAEHHMSFGGTITLDFDTFQSVLRCICRSLIRQGFRKILLLNGHGGNISALSVISDTLTRELECPIAATTYWVPAQAAFAELLEHQTSIGHACEAETSMLLAIAPELVDVDAAHSVRAPMGGLSDSGGIHVWRSTAYWTESGVIGAPHAASAEKGEALLDAAASALAGKLVAGGIWEEAPARAALQPEH